MIQEFFMLINTKHDEKRRNFDTRYKYDKK